MAQTFGMSLRDFSSRSTCAALAVPTSCVVVKNKHERNMFFSDKKHAIIVPIATRSRHLALFSVTGLLSQRNALLPRYFSWRPRSCLFEGLADAGNIICSMVGCVPYPHFMVWCVAVRGCSPSCLATSLKRICGIASWRGAAIGALEDTFAARD